MGPRPVPDSQLAVTLPMGDARLHGIAAENIGRCACGRSKEGAVHAGQTVGIAGEHLTGAEMAAAHSDALGREVVYQMVR